MSSTVQAPSGWMMETVLDSVTKIMDYRGRTPRKLGMSWGGGPIPALSARNVRMGRIDFSEECHLGSEALYRRWMTNGDMEAGDVIITTEAPLGNVAAIPDSRKYILSQRTVLLRPDPQLFDSTYFLKFLQSPKFQQSLIENATGSTALGIQRRRLERLQVQRPPLPEQRQIGSALEDADKLIEALERLIAKKQAMKQGTMQELLVGKTRLPGFTGEWTERGITDLATIDPETLSSGTSPGEVIDYISLEDVSRGVVLNSTQFTFREAPSRARRVIRDMDIVFGTVRPNLQSHAIYPGGLSRPVASTGFAVIRSLAGEADPRFLFYLLMSNLAMVQINRIIAGSNYPAVTSGDVRGLRFKVPNLKEQVAIGTVLNDYEADVKALQARLSKVKDIKQGMMQELLTGRTRLSVAEAAA